MPAKMNEPARITKAPDVIEGFPENFSGAWGRVDSEGHCNSSTESPISLSSSAMGSMHAYVSAKDNASAFCNE